MLESKRLIIMEHSLRLIPRRVLITAASAVLFTGCIFGSAPIKDAPQVVASPQAGQLSVTSAPASPVGDVQPVYISIANGTDTPRAIVPTQIFALNDDGNRVAPLPPGEAARQAGGPGDLKSALTSAAATGAVQGAVGAGVGAIAGSFLGGGVTGAALGGAIGAGTGLVEGASSGSQKATTAASDQITALALAPGDVRQDFTVSGYVFFPKGQYKQIQFLLVDDESGNTEIINRPWK
jgi:hypothetical protein